MPHRLLIKTVSIYFSIPRYDAKTNLKENLKLQSKIVIKIEVEWKQKTKIITLKN